MVHESNDRGKFVSFYCTCTYTEQYCVNALFSVIDKFSQIICGYIHVQSSYCIPYKFICAFVFQVTSENTIYVESQLYIHIARVSFVCKQ